MQEKDERKRKSRRTYAIDMDYPVRMDTFVSTAAGKNRTWVNAHKDQELLTLAQGNGTSDMMSIRDMSEWMAFLIVK